MLLSEPNQVRETKPSETDWRSLYKLGAFTALILIMLPPAEIVIGLLPGTHWASAGTATVVDWFSLFHDNWFLGLRNLGLLNLVGAALLVPSILAVYYALGRSNEAFGALGALVFFMGTAVYIASSRALPMLSLSRQYAAATTDVQRSTLTATGQTMLAEGQSRSGVLLIEFACLLISTVMLRGRVFSKATACAGILGNALLMVVEIVFIPVSSSPGIVVAACGGLSIMTWYLLVARRLFQLARA